MKLSTLKRLVLTLTSVSCTVMHCLSQNNIAINNCTTDNMEKQRMTNWDGSNWEVVHQLAQKAADAFKDYAPIILLRTQGKDS